VRRPHLSCGLRWKPSRGRLTEIGNQFPIRHHETTKTAIDPGDVDYFFHRCFALVALLLELNPSA